VLVELLRIGEQDAASGAHAGDVADVAVRRLLAACRALPACVWWCLLDAVHGSEMSLEDVCAVKALLRRASRTGAEAAHHRSFVMRQGVSVLVVFAGEALGVVLAGRDGALFRPLVLVGEHVRFEVFEVSAARRVRAEALAGFVGRGCLAVTRVYG
jgi:hypothetical protein